MVQEVAAEPLAQADLPVVPVVAAQPQATLLPALMARLLLSWASNAPLVAVVEVLLTWL